MIPTSRKKAVAVACSCIYRNLKELYLVRRKYRKNREQQYDNKKGGDGQQDQFYKCFKPSLPVKIAHGLVHVVNHVYPQRGFQPSPEPPAGIVVQLLHTKKQQVGDKIKDVQVEGKNNMP